MPRTPRDKTDAQARRVDPARRAERHSGPPPTPAPVPPSLAGRPVEIVSIKTYASKAPHVFHSIGCANPKCSEPHCLLIQALIQERIANGSIYVGTAPDELSDRVFYASLVAHIFNHRHGFVANGRMVLGPAPPKCRVCNASEDEVAAESTKAMPVSEAAVVTFSDPCIA
eukprot:m.48358 g.48358  ORF g.48358 m.48358 type:complete len:170 (+) comp6416_c0_seq1:1150-1659(+)